MAEPTLKDVLDALAKLDSKIERVDLKVERIDSKVERLETHIDAPRADVRKGFAISIQS